MDLGSYLALPFAQHALIAGTLIAVTCGVLSPFVLIHQMAFAVEECVLVPVGIALHFTISVSTAAEVSRPDLGVRCGALGSVKFLGES